MFIDRFQSDLNFFSGKRKERTMACFKDYNNFILRHLNNPTKESAIASVARIITNDIKKMEFPEGYPTSQEILAEEGDDKWMPASLQLLMKTLLPANPLQRKCFGQCIVQILKPRKAIPPIPYGIGVSLEKRYASKWLVQFLSKLGLSISYEEVNRFKQSAVANMKASRIAELESQPNRNHSSANEDILVQYVADNFDHNQKTLLGKGTFHAIAMICVTNSITPSAKVDESTRIPRCKEKQSTIFSDDEHGVKITPYYKSFKDLQRNLVFSPLDEVKEGKSSISFLRLLWNFGSIFPSEIPRPSWSGFMEASTCCFAQVKEKSKIDFLPMIDLNPNEMTCVYSTLQYIIDQAGKIGLPYTPTITFDQPLWLKAMCIVKEESMPIVCRLGAFHMLMSYMGGIGNIMKGCGLQQAFEQVYAPNSVTHMMSGKKIARALRAHTLTYSALMSLLIDEALKEGILSYPDELRVLYNKALNKELEQDEIELMESSHEFKLLLNKMSTLKDTAKQKSRTAALWISYMEQVELAHEFIAADRSSNWDLHLVCVRKFVCVCVEDCSNADVRKFFYL